MNNEFLKAIERELYCLKRQSKYRTLSKEETGSSLEKEEKLKTINLSSNDYLGIMKDAQLREEFLQSIDWENTSFSACSSRLLTGNHIANTELEKSLCNLFGSESSLIFSSGYHMNAGIIPAVSTRNTLLLADKLVHASLIDGIRLANAKWIRYRHADYDHLEKLIKSNINRFERILIITESIFSMDGEVIDLRRLVELKRKYPAILLYVDEAHAVGVRGPKGLGCAEEQGCISEIDFLVGTFGKALASTGGYLLCHKSIRSYLINKARTLIYTTAIPPFNLLWSKFVLERLENFMDKRTLLQNNSTFLRKILLEKGYECRSQSHIIPIIIGSSEETLLKAEEMRKQGYYLLALRPPTVPIETSRIRISLNAGISREEVYQFSKHL